jgi:hypothetical protein
MNAYDDFCEFAWMHLEDVFGITEEDGISDRSPYFEFIVGCAAIALSGCGEGTFAFTLKQVMEDSGEGLARKFFKEFSR